MTNVIRIRPKEPDLRVTVAELLERVAKLEADQTEIKARLPRRRFTAPPGWLCAQQAAHVSGMSLAGFYRKWRKLGVIGVKFDRGCFMFDPASLPVRKL